MKDSVIEFLMVLGHSHRTQWILIIGIVFALSTWLLGSWWTGHIELTGLLAGMTAAIETLIRDRFTGVALGILATSLAAGVRAYRKDRKRLLGV